VAVCTNSLAITVMNMFGKFLPQNKRKQDCLLFTEDNRVLEVAPEALRGCVAEHKTQEAWELYPDYRIPKKGTNRLFQLISERDIAPLALNGSGGGKKGEERKKRTCSQIAQDSASEARTNPGKQSDRDNKAAGVARLLAVIFGFTVCIMALIGFLMGQFTIGGGGGGGSIFATILTAFGFLPSKKKEAGAGKRKLNTLVLDPNEGFGLEHVDNPKGHRRNYKGKPVFVMERVYQDNSTSISDAALKVFEIQKDPGESPRKLYRGLTAWSKLTPIIFSLKNPLWETIKTVGLYVLDGALLLVIWLMYSSMVG
jgi:hypothetical protein